MRNQTKFKEDSLQNLLKNYKISQIFRIEKIHKIYLTFLLMHNIYSYQRPELGPEKNLINNIKIIPANTAKLKFITV